MPWKLENRHPWSRAMTNWPCCVLFCARVKFLQRTVSFYFKSEIIFFCADDKISCLVWNYKSSTSAWSTPKWLAMQSMSGTSVGQVEKEEVMDNKIKRRVTFSIFSLVHTCLITQRKLNNLVVAIKSEQEWEFWKLISGPSNKPVRHPPLVNIVNSEVFVY